MDPAAKNSDVSLGLLLRKLKGESRASSKASSVVSAT